MSGFEVAGIILGTIPLVISALEHYHDGVSTIQRWRKYQRERQSLVKGLNLQQQKLQNICEKLLMGLVPMSQIEIMIKDPFGSQWHDLLISRKLRARLHDSAEMFQTTLSDIRDAMMELRRRLNIDPEYRNQAAKSSTIKREFRRFVFTISRSTYSDLMLVIRNGIADLQTLTDQNVSLEPQRQGMAHTRLLTLLRELSAGLHRALENSLTCACAHTLKLKLAARPSELIYTESEAEMLEELDLHLLLSSLEIINDTADQSPNCQKWRGLRVHAVPTKLKDNILMPSNQSKSRLQASPQASPQFINVIGKRVVFHSMPSYTSTTLSTTVLRETSTASIASSLLPALSARASREPKCIGNLCEEIAISCEKTSNDCYGLILDSNSQATCRYIVYPANVGQHIASSRMISLRDVWDGGETIPFMSYKDRLQLAVTISSSFLQLHDTPWLPGNLSADGIIFLQGCDSYIYENVFIWKAMREEPMSLTEPVSLFTTRRKPTLLSLGFLLVEIFFGRPLGEEMGIGSRGQTLERKFREVQGQLSRLRFESLNYFSAVSRCLDGELHTAACDGMKLRENVYSGVVALLKEDLKALS